MKAEGQITMSRTLEPMLGELRQEGATTRRVLERVPADKLTWKPHAKSMSLGQLAMHVAKIPGEISNMAKLDEFEASGGFNPVAATNVQELLTALDASLKAAEEYLAGASDSQVMANWRLTMKGKEILNIPRIALLRTIMLNHWYHHRGQLSVYLRLLDVPVPSIYGPSADENPFA
jgi:uncharacterized damage-inducible protein DinB